MLRLPDEKLLTPVFLCFCHSYLFLLSFAYLYVGGNVISSSPDNEKGCKLREIKDRFRFRTLYYLSIVLPLNLKGKGKKILRLDNNQTSFQV